MPMSGCTKEATLLVICRLLVCSVLQTDGLEYYEFRLGADANITFTKTINEQSTIRWDILSTDGDRPFCIDGTFIPDALQPSQRGRFQILANRTKSKFSATFQIRQIEQIDTSVYILSLEERTEDNRASYLDAYVDVLRPPGKATCETRQSDYSNVWREVRCTATLSSDGGGFIECFQDGAKAPLWQNPKHSPTHLSAVFWMNINFPVHCCSHYVNDEKDESSCTDFTADLSPTPHQEQDRITIDVTDEMWISETPFNDGTSRMTTLKILKNLPTDDRSSCDEKSPLPLADATVNKATETRPILNLIVLPIFLILHITIFVRS